MTNMIWDKNLEESVVSEGGTHGEDVSARTSSRRYYNSRDSESTYTWKAAHICLANKVAFYIKHTDADTTLIIDSVQCKSTVDCEFIICMVSGVASGGSAVTGANWTAGSSNASTTKSGALENNVTGLSSTGDIADIDVKAGVREIIQLDGAVRIPNGYALAIMCDKAGTINVNVFGEFE